MCDQFDGIEDRTRPEDREQDEADICETCAWWQDIPDLVTYLYRFLELQDGGCQPGRHELLDEHWVLLGFMRIERDNWRSYRRELEAAEKKAREEAKG